MNTVLRLTARKGLRQLRGPIAASAGRGFATEAGSSGSGKVHSVINTHTSNICRFSCLNGQEINAHKTRSSGIDLQLLANFLTLL